MQTSYMHDPPLRGGGVEGDDDMMVKSCGPPARRAPHCCTRMDGGMEWRGSQMQIAGQTRKQRDGQTRIMQQFGFMFKFLFGFVMITQALKN